MFLTVNGGWRRALTACAALAFFWGGVAAAATLITDDEAKRPNDPQTGATRGITRGPSIRFEPPPTAPAAHAPFDFRIRLEAHGGSAIDPSSLKVIYLKVPNVDLTDRLRPYLTVDGIDMAQAQVPSGDHPFRVEVRDSEGRAGEAVFTVNVGP
jgi:hypothetical protein